MITIKAITLTSSVATTIFFIAGVPVSADRSSEWNAAPDFYQPTSSVRHDRETKWRIATSVVGGFNGAGGPSQRPDGGLGTTAPRRQITPSGISRARRPSDTAHGRVSGSGLCGYRPNERGGDNGAAPASVNGRAGAPVSSLRGRFRPSDRSHGAPAVSGSSRTVVPGDRRERSKLSSSIAGSIPRSSSPLVPALSRWIARLQSRVSTFVQTVNKEDLAIVVAYVCTQLAITIPVILLPMIAADPFLPTSTTSHLPPKLEGTAFVGAMATLSTLGAATGKFANGFVCRSVGGRTAGGVYLLGLAAFSLLLSTTASLHGPAIAGMEFCASIMWTACSVTVANRYEGDPKGLKGAIMALSLGSTGGVLAAKILGTALLGRYHWRRVARFAGGVALVGSAVMFCFVRDVERGRRARSILWTKGGSQDRSNGFGWNDVSDSAFRVLSNRAFWMVGFAHATAYLARSSDKLLGSFVRDVTGLPIYLCGSLTSSVTIGFVIGLISGRKIDSLESPGARRLFTSRRYRRAALSAVALALCANRTLGALIGGTTLAVAITLASGVMASSVAYQFYQFPAAFGSGFDDDRAVCISFVDGMACLVASPIWSMVSRLVASARLGSHGWSLAWLVIAGFFGIGGNVMMRTLSSVIPSVGKER